MTELDVITNLPPWLLSFVNSSLVFIANLTGREVTLSSVKPVPNEPEN